MKNKNKDNLINESEDSSKKEDDNKNIDAEHSIANFDAGNDIELVKASIDAENGKKNGKACLNAEHSKEGKSKKHKSHHKKNKMNGKIKILFITLAISFCFGLLSELLMSVTHSAVGIIISIVLLAVFIFISVICDMIGVATAGADIEHFRAMASKKVKGSKEAISLIKNADKTSSFFCDIVGDACGIMCGSIGAGLVVNIAISGEMLQVIIASLIAAIIAGLTVFGKAVGKSVAINSANKIVLRVGVIINFFKRNKNK